INEHVAASDDQQALVETNLKRALDLATDCQAAYASAPPHIRKLFNQAFFKKLYIDDDSHLRSELAAPFDILLTDRVRAAAAEVVPQADNQTAEVKWSPLQ